jgi:hypothetical protein
VRSRTLLTTREVIAYSLVTLSPALIILSIVVLFEDQILEGQDYCGTNQALQVCAQLTNQYGQFLALVVIGVGLLILGIYLGFRFSRETNVAESAQRQQ